MGYPHPFLSKIEDTWYMATVGSCTFTMYHGGSHWNLLSFLCSFILCSFSSVRITRFWLKIRIDCEKWSRAPLAGLIGLFDWFKSSLSSIFSFVSSFISSSLGAMEFELNWSCKKHSDLLTKWSFNLCNLLYSLTSMSLLI